MGMSMPIVFGFIKMLFWKPIKNGFEEMFIKASSSV